MANGRQRLEGDEDIGSGDSTSVNPKKRVRVGSQALRSDPKKLNALLEKQNTFIDAAKSKVENEANALRRVRIELEEGKYQLKKPEETGD